MSTKGTDIRNRKIGFLRAELTRLKKEMDPINDQIYNLRNKGRDFQNKRNELHSQNKIIRESIKEERTRRDLINEEVRTSKKKRNEIWDQIRKEVEIIREKTGDIPSDLPKKESILQKREKELEWRQQTTPLTRDQERKIVDEIVEIEEELEEIRTHKKRIEGLSGQSKTIDELKEKAELYHKEVQEKAEISQQIHFKMIESLQKLEENQQGADQYHQSFIKQFELIQIEEESIKKLREEFDIIITEVKGREQKERKDSLVSKKIKQETIIKTKLDNANKKIKSGKKMTFDEYFFLQKERDENKNNKK
ncbi:MAG: DUF7121 family protein [Candidatus Ranarchaeia archaeon]